MTQTETDFRRYMDENQQLPENCTLGQIVWYNASDEPTYDIAFVERSFDLLNLNPAMLPVRTKAINAFEKASSTIDKHKYPMANNATAEILVRESRRTEEVVIRQLTREIRDKSGKKVELEYNRVGELVFYKATSRGGVTQPGSERLRVNIDNRVNLDPKERAIVQELLDQVRSDYERYRDYYDGPKIRFIVRDYLRHLNAIKLKDGIYFVHNSRLDELMRLQEFVRGLKTASMTTLPLPDLSSMRQEVVDAFQEEAEKDLNDVAKSILTLRASRKTGVNMSAYLKVKEEYERVMRKASEYGRTLKVSQERTAGAAETTLDLLLELEAEIRMEMEKKK